MATRNYGEELGYWYLRFNGFFPLRNAVLHRGKLLRYTSDCDLLAIRPPHVFEEIGGQPDDWDAPLQELVSGGATVGLVCEVKTGAFAANKLFPLNSVTYSLFRLGLVKDPHRAAKQLVGRRMVESDGVRFAKLLITASAAGSDEFYCVTMRDIERFFRWRLERYESVKYRDRLFFPSELLQHLIQQSHDRAGARKLLARGSSGRRDV